MTTAREQQLLQIVEQDLHQDCADYLTLRGLMQELYQQLLKRDSRQIDLLNEQILPLVDQAKARAERRSKVLAAFQLGSGNSAMQKLLARYPQAQRKHLELTWEQLGQLAGQCKRLNERNGKLLAMHNEILEQLLGEPGAGQLYTPQPY
ncbi:MULTISPECIES: flagellar export chaperone FlgN [unclassified Pseudomonas]|uniref:flagellar export chaperone FlgN n=1 Tax=unclassified Pseudomonas TaxID=196821 RepID=UPI000EDB70B1|nr:MULTISPECIES: flagellar export chaperone FlgN [unclassified Pseudomonas]HBZ94521.1 flagellar protein FlgN [Pseudomonas sp.]